MDAWAETDWSLMDFDEKPKAKPIENADEKPCPNCGVRFKIKGLHHHVRKCTGNNPGSE